MVASFSFPASKISAIKRPPIPAMVTAVIWSDVSNAPKPFAKRTRIFLFVPPALHSGALTDRGLERLPRNGKINTPLLYQKEGDKHGHSLHQLDVPLVGQNLRLFPAF